MNKRIFLGVFKVNIIGLIEEKKALGYSYEDSAKILESFDRFCIKNYPNETILTKDMCMHWAERRSSENSASLSNRIIPVRSLGKYMQCRGLEAFIIPKGITGRRNKYVPHFFTHEELSLFFMSTDSIKYNHNYPERHLVIPVMFRLIYTCGLRPVEVRRLMITDVDLVTGNIHIRESKGHKSRIIVVSDDMLALCIIYRKKMLKIFPECEYFFPNYLGIMYSPYLLDRVFKQCWHSANTQTSNITRVRVYDLRHNFVTNCLYKWIREGKDLNTWLAYLSNFLGHANFSYTAYYIHLVPEFFPQMSQMDLSKFAELIPEVLS
jgi:integrase